MEGPAGVSATPSMEPLILSPHPRLLNSPKLSKYFLLIFPWIWTVIFLVAVIIFVKVFEQEDVMTPTQKNTFNLLSTALIVVLSLSFYVSMNCLVKEKKNVVCLIGSKESFKGCAKSFQPRLSRWYNLSPDIARKTQGFDNLLVVSSLLFYRVSWRFWLFCAAWVGTFAFR